MKTKNDNRTVFHSIRLCGEPDSIYKKVLIDGTELKGVKSATVCYEAGQVPRVFLEMISTDVEVDEPLAAVLTYTEEKNNEG